MSLENMTQSESIEVKDISRPVVWTEVEAVMDTFHRSDGGYSTAHRGLVTLEEGKAIFVKVGVDEATKAWASKEIQVYDFLVEKSYSSIPNLLSTNEDNTGFALEALRAEDGWDWSNTWNRQRLTATLSALDALAAIVPDEKYAELIKPEISDEDNGWPELAASEELQANLHAKLERLGESRLIEDISTEVERSLTFKVRHDALVHDDVRADNCPWNESLGLVKLVDWNWLELGDRRIDLAAALVHIHESGFDVLPNFSDRLDADALQWMAGFWLISASKPGAEKLRDFQLRAGITALKLARELFK